MVSFGDDDHQIYNHRSLAFCRRSSLPSLPPSLPTYLLLFSAPFPPAPADAILCGALGVEGGGSAAAAAAAAAAGAGAGWEDDE